MKKKISKSKIRSKSSKVRLRKPKHKKGEVDRLGRGKVPGLSKISSEIKLRLHNLEAPIGSHKRRKILGRGSGSGHGKTSTRGSNGQGSRSGRHFYLGFEGGQMPLIRKIPKRGFRSSSKKEYQIVNLEDLNRIKEPNINLDLLEQRGLIKDKDKLVKILGDGELKNPIVVQAHAISKNAAVKVKNAGGKVEIIHA